MNVVDTSAAGLGVEELDELTVPVIAEFVAGLLAVITGLVVGLLGGGA